MGAVNTESVMGIAYTIILPVMVNVQLVLITVLGTVREITSPATANAMLGGNSVDYTSSFRTILWTILSGVVETDVLQNINLAMDNVVVV